MALERSEPEMSGAPITLSGEALAKIREFRRMSGESAALVRITIRPKAPVAEKYELEFVSPSSIRPEEAVFSCEDVGFVMDPRSARLIEGTHVDFREGMWSSGFHFDNPNQALLLSDPLATKIQRVIEDRVFPMVAAHGGRVTLADVRDQRAFVRFGGGCQGCGLAPQTLKRGVAQILRQEVPEIVEVLDVTDHAAGESPYYASKNWLGSQASG